jgi:predicted Zn-dependent protease
MEKKQSGMLSKALSTHPMTTSRIKAAQKEIETILVVKPQYVVNTSEFDDVKGRLTKL